MKNWLEYECAKESIIWTLRKKLYTKCIKDGNTLYTVKFKASLKDNVKPHDFIKGIVDILKGRAIVMTPTVKSTIVECDLVIQTGGCASVMINQETQDCSVIIDVLSDHEVGNVKNYFWTHCVKTQPQGQINIMCATSSGLEVRSIGMASSPFIAENYRPEVKKDYEYVVEQLSSREPRGRIVIFDGIPGCGKTFLIKSLLDDVRNCIFIIVPQSMVSALGNPEIVPTLMDNKEDNRSIVLIVEDGDSVLQKRGTDNMSAISALLNLSDGIIGRIIDLKIVVTTNLEINQIDEAILRNGRLCKRIEINKLDRAQAEKVYERLTNGKKYNFKDPYVRLADIYEAAYGTTELVSLVSSSSSKKPVGFDVRSSEVVHGTKVFYIDDEDEDDDSDLIDEDP